MKRKPPVVAIRGNLRADVISQKDLRQLSDLQAIEWASNRATQKAASQIETRIAHGARIAAGELTFDPEMKMARTRKVEQKA